MVKSAYTKGLWFVNFDASVCGFLTLFQFFDSQMHFLQEGLSVANADAFM